MKIAVLSFSPKNETSLTYHSMLYLQKVFKEDTFDIKLVGGQTEPKEDAIDAIKEADLVIFLSSLFHFSIPHQMMIYIDKLVDTQAEMLKTKTFTYYTTSGKIMDIAAHSYMERFFTENGFKMVRFCSQYDRSLTEEKGRSELVTWFKFIKGCMTLGDDVKCADSECVVKVVDVSDGNNSRIEETVVAAVADYEARGAKVTRINMRDYKIRGCTACFCCYTENVCPLNKTDDWAKCYEDIFKDSEIVLYVGESHYGMMGPIHKSFLDRQVQFGRFKFDCEHINAFLIDCPDTTNGALDMNEFRIHTEAMNGFGGITLGGLARLNDMKKVINESVLCYNFDVYPAENFYGVGVRLKFAKLSVEIKNMTPADYDYFKKCGDLDWQSDYRVMPIHDAEGAQRSKSGRLIPYRAIIADAENKEPVILSRKHLPRKMPAFEYVPEKPKKKGLFGRR